MRFSCERRVELLALALYAVLPPVVALLGSYSTEPVAHLLGPNGRLAYLGYAVVVILAVAGVLYRYRQAIKQSEQAPFYLTLSFAFVLLFNPIEEIIGAQHWMGYEPLRAPYLLIVRGLAILVWYQIIKLIFWPDPRTVSNRDPTRKTAAYWPLIVYAVISPLLGFAQWLILSRDPTHAGYYVHPLILAFLLFATLFLLRHKVTNSNFSPAFVVVSFVLFITYFISFLTIVTDWVIPEREWRNELAKYSVDLYRLAHTALSLFDRSVAAAAAYLLLNWIFAPDLFAVMRRRVDDRDVVQSAATK